MHELSIVRALLRQVGRVAGAHGGGPVRRVTVRLGPLSGVEPALLAQAFPKACAGTAAAGAELVIESVPVRVQCRACGHVDEAAPNRLRCPACGCAETVLVGGDELLLVSVDLEGRLNV
ncbi:hydrogenase maturation nickel metallochaperone HypA [Thiofaba sp. EF100]|uniref:hydrogenase maturation nickel metallochaperone HypA/HybF n=1 Tax=Thiofaba sp. EF100 TaxID=3121274 RepID=UPI003221453D